MSGRGDTSRSGQGCGGHLPWYRAREAARRLGEQLQRPPRDLRLADALGGVLGADVHALVGLPAFDASAMDGFAVTGGGPWRLVGRQLAGGPVSSAGLGRGEAVEIATGARVPKNTESVLPYELATTTTADGEETVEGNVDAGRHVRWSGEEIAPGETVLPRGTVITPAVLGLAASLGHESLPALLPRVTVLVTGDEVATTGLPGEGNVRDAIGPVLPGVAQWGGARVGDVRYLSDGHEGLRRAVTAGGDGDVVAVCGSSSKGPADHFRSVLAEVGAITDVDGVACRPGHPQLLAHAGGTAYVGLPGNPGAALVAALTLLVPLVSAMAGRPDPAHEPRPVPLDGQVWAHHRDTRLVAVRRHEGRVRPVGHDRPASLRGAALADAYAVIPPGWDGEDDVELVHLP